MIMLKVLGAQIKEFKKDSLLTPAFMITWGQQEGADNLADMLCGGEQP